MKIRTFDPGRPIESPSINDERWEYFHIRGLSAYAIDHAVLFIDGTTHNTNMKDMRIENDNFHIKADFRGVFREYARFILQIHYYGIRDYRLLFPDVLVKDPDRANRLGLFYEEAEKCFDNGAWLSFALMCGAIFEHLLYFKLNGSENQYARLILKARNTGIIQKEESDTMEAIRKLRNSIHCNRLSESYIQRAEAMDIKTLIERLIVSL